MLRWQDILQPLFSFSGADEGMVITTSTVMPMGSESGGSIVPEITARRPGSTVLERKNDAQPLNGTKENGSRSDSSDSAASIVSAGKDSEDANKEGSSSEGEKIPTAGPKPFVIAKRSPDDFIFEKVLGEGSFSTVSEISALCGCFYFGFFLLWYKFL